MSVPVSYLSAAALAELLSDLPGKQRVHELAKRAGLSSKQVLSALADAGVVAKSSQSSVDQAQARSVLTAILTDPAAAQTLPAASSAADAQGSDAQPAARKTAPRRSRRGPEAAGAPAADVPELVAEPEVPAALESESEAGAPKRTRGRRRPVQAASSDAELALPSEQVPEFAAAAAPPAFPLVFVEPVLSAAPASARQEQPARPRLRP
ncbi:hypothetical protein EH165_10215 [Nakamurella antarctica]|uniref:Translation initiation factor IF-2 N-terminal domain-containing protein n=1 Tax=Nakamurella antarctica TaxID=1902245 RepID=A0A3G8ZNS1_9ACTN|nr:translation initiation factor IF-2 N-terminal domain-containing protein [Nakamurella antarctica]AZI58457.1 hypothetical protein EH165_10215 [Nakamurella antarctica]